MYGMEFTYTRLKSMANVGKYMSYMEHDGFGNHQHFHYVHWDSIRLAATNAPLRRFGSSQSMASRS